MTATLKRRTDDHPELLAYKDSKGWHDVKSTDINTYLDLKIPPHDGKPVLFAVGLAVSTNAPDSEAARKRVVSRAVKETADHLGNTPAVCRNSYIDPRVIDRFNDGRTIRGSLDKLGAESDQGELATLGPVEQAVLRLIRS